MDRRGLAVGLGAWARAGTSWPGYSWSFRVLARDPPPALAGRPPRLVLERAIAVSGPGDFQPSGLVLRDGRLFTVCDKNSGTLLEIPLDAGPEVEARPAIPIDLPGVAGENLDLEGSRWTGRGTSWW